MKLNVWCRTDKGLRRESNQDSYLVNEDLGLFIVADGMGGHSGGEVASAIAVKSVENFIRERRNQIASPRELIIKAYEEASFQIYDKAAYESPELSGMGTTMVLCYRQGSSMYIGNVGDSRAYLFRKPYIWQMTEDHSLVNEQLRAGIINDEQVKTFAGKNVITRSVGYEREVTADVLERPLQSGDCFLLCSDGLSGLVADNMIADIVSKNEPEKVPQACIDRALAHGGDDNVTVLFVQVI